MSSDDTLDKTAETAQAEPAQTIAEHQADLALLSDHKEDGPPAEPAEAAVEQAYAPPPDYPPPLPSPPTWDYPLGHYDPATTATSPPPDSEYSEPWTLNSLKAWVRREIELARQGHSEETRLAQNP